MTNEEIRAEVALINKSSDTDDLRSRFDRYCSDIGRLMLLASAAWKRLADLGKPVPVPRHGLLKFIPKIAGGQLMPELVPMLAANLSILEMASRLTPDDQGKVVRGEPFDLVSMNGDRAEVIRKPVHKLKLDEARLLFTFEGGIREPDEQRQRLVTKRNPATTLRTVTVGVVTVDPVTQTVMIKDAKGRGAKSAPAIEVLRALRSAGLDQLGVNN